MACHEKDIGKTIKLLSDIKLWTCGPLGPLTTWGEIHFFFWNLATTWNSLQEQQTPLKSHYCFNCLKACRERAKLKILPTYGTRACWHIDLYSCQLGLVREEGQTVNHGQMKKQNGSLFWKLRTSLKIDFQ